MKPDNLVEVSFEVANKVGGIYQVLKSKSGKMQDFYDDNYITVGFFNEESAKEDFIQRKDHEFKELFKQLEDETGAKYYYGVWDIPKKPRCILVDPRDLNKDVDEIKTLLWEEYGIDSLEAGREFEEPLEWCYAVGKLIEKLENSMEGNTVVHLHEWLSGTAMHYFESPKVFTTHATVLGRALSSSDFDLQSAVKEGYVDQALAEKNGVKPKHQVEKMSANRAEVFTTVSETTGREAEAVLEIEPDKILPNGFNVEEYPSLEELSYNHTEKKENVKNFLQAYFDPYYDVNLQDDPRILFTSGRYEFHNKGIDLLIDALGDLNEVDGKEFFVFFFVPAGVEGEKREVLENLSLFEEVEKYIDSLLPELREEIISSITSGEKPAPNIGQSLDDRGKVDSLKNKFHSKEGENPPLCAYDLNYEEDDIIDALQRNGLTNSCEDRVKVVFYPSYLSVGDKLLNMDYQDAVVASSAGIFPSYYEPWGYTPVETAANGSLSITTDMAGFGQFLKEKTESVDRKGINILERKNKEYSESKEDLARMIDEMVGLSKTEITERKHNARKLAQLTSWQRLGQNYKEAHELAVKKG